MMQHYMETKKEYPDCILFYRLGDFYEMFFDDALTVSKELEITLTGKDCGLAERAPMAVLVLSSTHKRVPLFCFSRRVSTSSRFLLVDVSMTMNCPVE